MAALSEEIARLTNPAPVFQDPEDNEDDTSAKVVGQIGEYDEDDDAEIQVSSLRKKAAVSLPDFDRKYAGKRISRKNLLNGDPISDEDDEEEEDDISDESDDDDASEIESNTDDEVDEDFQEEDDDDLKAFQSKVSKVQDTTQPSFSFKDDGDYSKYADMDDDEDSDDDDSEDDEEDNSEESAEDEEKINEVKTPQEDGGVSSFSKSSIEEEIQKGKAAKAQLTLWDSLLENRIQIQKVVGLVNQLPQCDTWQSFVKQGEEDFSSKAETAHTSLCTLLNKLIELQSYLLLQNTTTQYTITGDKKSIADARSDEEEEITSESDLGEEDADEGLKSKSKPRNEVKELMAKTGLKRKLKADQYPEFLAKRHTDFTEFRNTTIQKWYDKTRLIGGNKKSFSSFDKSAVKQIQQIMNDKQRLIKRTQLKRTTYHILGKTDTEDKDPAGEGTPDGDPMSVGDNTLKNYDPEIFDDSDFYHQQLRELIELKTQDTSDPLALSRQWLEIHKLRRKVKKKIDTRASKGRKVRYDVHKKLMNFMAPVDISTIPDESRDDLFKSLFGKRFQNSYLENDVELET